MTNVLLFHHAQGLTDGVRAFADRLRDAGHQVTLPDLYDGHTFDTLDEGIGYAKRVGFDNLQTEGVRAAEDAPDECVYAGFSLGVMPAQQLAQTMPGAIGALFFFSCLPPSEFGTWPADLPAQIHGMDADPWFAEEGDLEAARALVEQADSAELFIYPGDKHLFADSSLPDYDQSAAVLL
ncbi:MAG: dienelactone hydrolase family protein, partial [Candidatus Nanopelagicales bacterium]